MEKAGGKAMACQRGRACARLCAGQQGLWGSPGVTACGWHMGGVRSRPEPVRVLDEEVRSLMSILGHQGLQGLRRCPREGTAPPAHDRESRRRPQRRETAAPGLPHPEA